MCHESGFIIISIIRNRLSQVADPYDDHFIFLVKTQYRADFIIQTVYIISVSLLPEPAEVIQVLSDLGSSISDKSRELIGRNLADALSLQLFKISSVSRQSFDSTFEILVSFFIIYLF